jgi:hypothetical protein
VDYYEGLCQHPRDLSNQLATIFHTKFGGKDKGRYKITRKRFIKLAGVPELSGDYVHAVHLWLRKRRLILVDLDFVFLVLPMKPVKGLRAVTDEVIEPFVWKGDAEAEEPEDSED